MIVTLTWWTMRMLTTWISMPMDQWNTERLQRKMPLSGEKRWRRERQWNLSYCDLFNSDQLCNKEGYKWQGIAWIINYIIYLYTCIPIWIWNSNWILFMSKLSLWQIKKFLWCFPFWISIVFKMYRLALNILYCWYLKHSNRK